MARFRLVETDDNGNVSKEYYRSPMFPEGKFNKDFSKDYEKRSCSNPVSTGAKYF